MNSRNVYWIVRTAFNNTRLISNINTRSTLTKFTISVPTKSFTTLGCSVDTRILQPNIHVSQNNLVLKRFKKKRSRITKDNDEENDNDDDDDDELSSENPLLVDDVTDTSEDDSQQLTIDVGSLRLDAFGKVAFSSSRSKIEELFYKGDIRVNGERPAKKSVELAEGDEIDLVKQVNSEDSTLVDIKRVIIKKMPDKATETGRMKIAIKRWNNLTIKLPD